MVGHATLAEATSSAMPLEAPLQDEASGAQSFQNVNKRKSVR